MFDTDGSLDNLLEQVKTIHQISNDINVSVKEDLVLLDDMVGGVADGRRRIGVLREGVRHIRESARLVARYRLGIAVSCAFFIVLWLLL